MGRRDPLENMVKVSRNVRFMSVAFAFLFFGFDGIQQYITVFFDEANIRWVGFTTLIIVYVLFTLANPVAALIVGRIGARRSMMVAVSVYILFCLSLLTAMPWIIFMTAALLGVAAALLWTAQNSYLVRASDPEFYGTNSGFFSTSFSIGAAGGVLALGILLPLIGYTWGFFLFALVPVVALVSLSHIDDIRAPGTGASRLSSLHRAFRSPTALSMSAIWFGFNYIQGLMLSIVPLEIKHTIGVWAIGLLLASFYIMPMLFAYVFGALSDRYGRRPFIMAIFALSFAGVGMLMVSETPALLIFAILLLAFNFGVARTVTFALVGDIATPKSTESITALTWTVQSFALLLAISLSAWFEGQSLYIVSLGLIGLSLLLFLPASRKTLSNIKIAINREMA